jgi:acetyltransferase-like isoleucine patch superfamily enzyme
MIKHGKYTYGINNINILNWGEDFNIEIGSFCSIGGNITMFVGGNHNSNWITTYPFGHINQDIFNKHDGRGHPKQSRIIIIGNDVWIGGNTTIMNGVIIGDGSIISANSHVVKDIPPYTIVGGNPAKYINQRFNYEIVKKLLKLQWWNLPDEIINQLSPFLCCDDINEFFKEVEKLKIKDIS